MAAISERRSCGVDGSGCCFRGVPDVLRKSSSAKLTFLGIGGMVWKLTDLVGESSSVLVLLSAGKMSSLLLLRLAGEEGALSG